MKYFLKNIGTAKVYPHKNPIKDFEDFGSLFWEEESRIWFSNNNFGGKMSKGDIIIQYIPLGYKLADYAGRIVGCFEVLTDYTECQNGQWKGYRSVVNKSLAFSNQSKYKTVLHIKKVMNSIPKAIQCGCAEISFHEAERIIQEIMKNN